MSILSETVVIHTKRRQNLLSVQLLRQTENGSSNPVFIRDDFSDSSGGKVLWDVQEEFGRRTWRGRVWNNPTIINAVRGRLKWFNHLTFPFILIKKE